MPQISTARRDVVALEALRRRVRTLEHRVAGVLAFGAPEIDRALPWGGLALGCVHEVAGDDGAALGFVGALLARLLRRVEGAVLWCLAAGSEGGLYGPGLSAFGLDPERLILVRAPRDADVLWAMREGLGGAGLAAVVGEARRADARAGRRLQLAAEASGVTGFLLRPADQAPSAAVTRWSLRAAPSGLEAGWARWHAHLVRCRGGMPGAWLLEWRHETGGFAVAAPLCDRPAEPAAAGLAH